jgi:hypothetical protein
MKNRSALSSSSTAACGSCSSVETKVGCGRCGTICFLFKYFGQFPVEVSVSNCLITLGRV